MESQRHGVRQVDLGQVVQHHHPRAVQLRGRPSEALQAVICGTVLFEPVIIALRRLAQEPYAREVLSGSPGV